jgi:hypothetical protein
MPPHITQEYGRFDLGNVVFVDSCESSVDAHNDQLATTLSVTEKNFRQQRSVMFAEFIKVVDIPHIKNLSNEEIENTWMSREEMRFVKMECLDTLALMNAGETLNENIGLCERGLEKHTVISLERSGRIKCCAYEAVFGMQKFHRLRGFSLPNLMAELYNSSSAPSQSEARKRGFRDASANISQ